MHRSIQYYRQAFSIDGLAVRIEDLKLLIVFRDCHREYDVRRRG